MLKRQCGEKRWGKVKGKECGEQEDGGKSDVAGVDVL